MDLVASCKEKLVHFRIKELKDVLTQLGLSKQGKKQDLVDRLLSVLSEEQVSRMWQKKNITKEEVVRLVDDIYRKMQVSGATDLASKGQGGSESSSVKIKGEYADPFRSDTKIRCPCGDSLEKGSVIECEEPSCHVWQHMGCVLIPEKPMESNQLPVPEVFYCEICRLRRADPFWVTVANPLNPVRLSITNIPSDGTNPVQSVEKTFQLTRTDKDLLSKAEYDVQAWCMLLNDKVPFRMQWPQYADLQVNGMPVRAINRPGSQLLGANGRDDGPIITPCTRDGVNKISLSGCDARVFCMGVRIVKRRTVQQILNLIPKESEGEPFEDALARVCRVGGGGAADAGSDSDIEVVADSFSVNLRCPMSGSRMKVAGRFKPCAHMGCFDLEVFVEMNQRSRKWQCPVCLKNYSLENVIIDPYFNRITTMMRHCGEDITEIDVKPDGSWRVKTKSESERRELGDLSKWHLPDGTVCVPADEKVPPKAEFMKQVKQEVGSDGPTKLKLGIRKNQDGMWEVSKPGTLNNSYGNQFHDKFEDDEPNVIPMSSSATMSGKDGEDPSVNQDGGGGNFDFSANNGIDLDSTDFNVDPTFGFAEQNPAAVAGNAEVVVLSDSDDDNDILISSGTANKSNQLEPSGMNFPLPHTVMADSFEDSVIGNGGTSCLGLFNSNDDAFGEMPPLWSLPPGSQAGPGFQLFTSDGNVSDAIVDLPYGSISCSTVMNGYTMAPENDMGPAAVLPHPPMDQPDTQLNDNLVDNPLAMGGDDPSLQIFLPTRPSGASVQSDTRNQADMSNGVRTDDWISLSLGGGAAGCHTDSAEANGFSSRQQVPSADGALDSLADTASLLLGMNEGRSEKFSRQRPDSFSSFPRQKRSVRQRFYFAIDSESE